MKAVFAERADLKEQVHFAGRIGDSNLIWHESGVQHFEKFEPEDFVVETSGRRIGGARLVLNLDAVDLTCQLFKANRRARVVAKCHGQLSLAIRCKKSRMQVSGPTIYVTENQKQRTISTRNVFGKRVLQLTATF